MPVLRTLQYYQRLQCTYTKPLTASCQTAYVSVKDINGDLGTCSTGNPDTSQSDLMVTLRVSLDVSQRPQGVPWREIEAWRWDYVDVAGKYYMLTLVF